MVKGVPSEAALNALREGVLLEDGLTAPARVSIVKQLKGSTVLTITIHEGKKRQIKRMCEAVGYPVVRLHREKFGPIDLGDLSEGAYRLLLDEEVTQLRASIG